MTEKIEMTPNTVVIKTMNVYEKIQRVRVDLQNLKLQKSGKNAYSNFTYFELADFLPAVNSLCDKYSLCTHFNIISDKHIEKAVLTVFNSSDPNEKVVFVSKTAEVEIGRKKDGTGGAEPIQNLGGKITYMRRYLMMMAFEVVDTDMVDSINREMTDGISDEDQTKIRASKDFAELTKVCGSFKEKYKISLINPIFEEMKQKLAQKESKA